MTKALSFSITFLAFGCLLIFSETCSAVAVGAFNNDRPRSESQQAELRQMPDTDFEDGKMDLWYDVSAGDVYWAIEDYSKPSEVNNPAPAPFAGTKYLRVLRDSLLNSGPVTAKSTPFVASPGDTVTFSFWIQSNRTQNNDLELIMAVGNTRTVLIKLSRYSSSTNFEWREVDPIPIPVTEPTTIEFMFYGYCGNDILDAIAVDDFKVISGGSEVISTVETLSSTITPTTVITEPSTTPSTYRPSTGSPSTPPCTCVGTSKVEHTTSGTIDRMFYPRGRKPSPPAVKVERRGGRGGQITRYLARLDRTTVRASYPKP